MHQRRLAKLLFRPSLFSTILTTILTIIILGVAAWPYTESNTLLYESLRGPHGLLTTIQKSPDITLLTSSLLTNSMTYNLVILGVAGLIAAGVYAILQTLSRLIVNSYDTWHAVHDADSPITAEAAEKEIGARTAIRLLSMLLWIAFIFFFVKILLPYCIVAIQISIDNLLTWKALYGLAAYGALLMSLHIHVVFARLILLRPRVFGGRLDITEAMYEADDHTT